MATYSRAFKHIGRAKAADYRRRCREARAAAQAAFAHLAAEEEEERLRWHYWAQEQAASRRRDA